MQILLDTPKLFLISLELILHVLFLLLKIPFSSYRPSKKHRYSTVANTSKESADVISKVREWLNAWRPDHENIRITARKRPSVEAVGPADETATRESYEIEIVEKKEQPGQRETAVYHKQLGSMASDLPAFVSEISSVSQGRWEGNKDKTFISGF